jgi:HPt (histidine-containing phosphotransfer) domain-containing protein
MTTLMTSVQHASPTSHGPLAAHDAKSAVDASQHRPLPGWKMDRPAPAAERSDSADAAATDAAVDIMALLGRCLGNFELIMRVLARFRKSGGGDIEQLALAIEKSDFTAVVDISHRFKGAAGNISAAGLHKVAAGMEQFGREQNLAQLPGLLSQLQVEWAAFLRFADAFAPPGGVTPANPVK